uniref:Gamma-aminobutyric acid receptor subunit beta n=1 Tax=Ditylenchus dipsaci TaxID=166011 RepID=A0A915DXS0_9BILA
MYKNTKSYEAAAGETVEYLLVTSGNGGRSMISEQFELLLLMCLLLIAALDWRGGQVVLALPAQMPPPNVDVFHKSDKEIEYNTGRNHVSHTNRHTINHVKNGKHKHSEHSTASSSSFNDNNFYATRELEKNVSNILDFLIASHDRRIRPNYGGPPTEVNVTALVITISAVSEVSMDYTVDLYLRQFWRDPRLAFDTLDRDQSVDSSLTVGIDMVKSIWVPDTFFPNEKKSFFHETTSHNSFLRIDNHGNVIRSIRLTVTANCPMNLHTFPLDVQVCALEIESYGYSTNDIIYHWHPTNPVTIDENVHLAHFSIGDHYHIERMISLSTGNYSRLTAYFTFKRNIGFYLIQIYFPSSLIVVISWVSFFLNREATQARVAIGVTTVLTQTTLMTSTNASLPKVSYVNLLEYATVGFLMKRQRYRTFSSNPRTSNTICYYELDEGSPNTVRLSPQQQASQAAAAATQHSQQQIQLQNKPRRFSRRSISTNGGTEQVVPLLSVSSPNQSPNRMSILIPAESMGALNGSASCYSASANWYICRIRASQVDLFSRVAFPVFFLVFHIVYWTVYVYLI